MKAQTRLKIRKWLKRILIVCIGILLIIALSKGIMSLTEMFDNPSNISRQEEIKQNYDNSVFGNVDLTDEKKLACAEVIKSFVKYGNQKDYESIFNMLTEDYKSISMNDVESVKEYIDRYFDAQKGYSYQNIMNIENAYIYEVKIYDDLMLSGSNSYSNPKQNKIYFVIKDNNGELKVNLDGLISVETIDKSVESEYMQITVDSKSTYYDKVEFNLSVKNLTDNRILTMYDNDIKFILYNTSTNQTKEYTNYSIKQKLNANCVMPEKTEKLTMTYKKSLGLTDYIDYKINIDTIYSYDLADYLEVLFENPNITEKAKETYTNVNISLN